MLTLLAACRPDPLPPAGTGPTGDAPCEPGPAVVTDIDETLTTDDDEWIAQLIDGTHDPAARPDGDLLMQGLADAGYAVFYLTARGDDPVLTDGRGAFEATEDWLVDHGFPYTPGSGRLFLSDGIGVTGDAAAEYKALVLATLQGEGWTFAWAFGNADSDIDAYEAAGIPSDHQLLVGELAGTRAAEPVPDADAYAAFAGPFLAALEPATCP